MKIVKFEDGTYGVKRKWLLFFDEFLSHSGSWLVYQSEVCRLCKFNSLEEAKDAMLMVSIKHTEIE